jgi:hypothetical protein
MAHIERKYCVKFENPISSYAGEIIHVGNLAKQEKGKPNMSLFMC